MVIGIPRRLVTTRQVLLPEVVVILSSDSSDPSENCTNPCLLQDPSVPAPSPHYAPPTNQQYAHYPPQNSHPMSETYSNGGHGNWRPEWGPPTGQHYMNGAQYNPHGSPTASVSSLSPGGTPVNRNVKQAGRKRISDQTAQHPLSQVYSFVPIPGAQQHKRPRRRYEEIERMYKCGYNGCEKAYGTLNHLNAHVTMQSHGVKRTPEGILFSLFPFILFYYYPRPIHRAPRPIA